jgi:amino acid transporter
VTTPYVALLLQLLSGVLFVFLGQVGTNVRGAYDVLVSMGIITYFIPYGFLFAAMFRVQREKAGRDLRTRRQTGRQIGRVCWAAYNAVHACTRSSPASQGDPQRPTKYLRR